MQTLTGNWKLATDPENAGREKGWFKHVQPEAEDAPVPGIIQQVYPTYHGVAWYWQTFRVQDNIRAYHPKDGRFLLRFGAVDYLADVWINGHHAGTHEGGETPFEFDITDHIEMTGENLLAVRVLNPTTIPIDGYLLGQIPHRNKVVPPTCGSSFNLGGIMYPVELRSVPPVYITDLFTQPDIKTGTITAKVTVHNTLTKASAGNITLNVVPAAGGDLLQIIERQCEFLPGQSDYKLALAVPQPRLWNLDDPFLYRVTAIVTARADETHQISVRCGFRDFRVVDGYFHLNGKRIFLKSTHTGNAMPIGQQLAVIPDHVRRDLLYAKASGFNTVRFIAGVAFPDQLDFCDEIGLMVYEECYAGWCLEDSPKMGERFDDSISGMVLRDRNHPSVTIWGLLNETRDGPVFRQAVGFLPRLRQLDPTRLVLLGSGRWDASPTTGSVSNPGSTEWEPVWGVEGEDAPKVDATLYPFLSPVPSGYIDRAGDAHAYPTTPQSLQTEKFMRQIGQGTKPVFLSEYGIGSMMDVIREWRHFEQVGARPDLEDARMLREQSEAFYADWKRLGFDDVYPFPEDLLRESQRLHSQQRTIGFNIIRSNPKLCGYNLTGILDHGITGEGLWTFWREWKPGTFDAVSDGWSPLRWCLFVDPLNGYSGQAVTIEAVLANENALKPGEYPARFRIFGPTGVAWEKTTSVKIPDPAQLAVPVLRETVSLQGPPGQYIFAANLERGGAPLGGRLVFYQSDPTNLPRLKDNITLWGIEKHVEDWLAVHGLHSHKIDFEEHDQREVILVGKPGESENNSEVWGKLSKRMEQGSVVIFLDPQIFKHNDDSTYWLPLTNKGRCYAFADWLYHKECVAKQHPVFDGLQAPGIMDWNYYGPVIPHYVFEGLDTPDETIVAGFATGYYAYPSGYGSSLLIAAYRLGKGCFILNTPCILENLGTHPAADRLLLNLIHYAQSQIQKG